MSFNEKMSNVSLFLIPISNDKILTLIKFQIRPSCGTCGINNIIIKSMGFLLVNVLSYFCNLSISSGIFPDNMKKANTIPISKTGDSKIPGNYRPISLRSVFSKLLEKCIKSRIWNFLKDTNFFNKSQFRFREKLSKKDAHINFLEYNILFF